MRQKLDYRDYMVCHLKGVGGLFARRNAAKRHGEKLADIPVDWSDWEPTVQQCTGHCNLVPSDSIV